MEQKDIIPETTPAEGKHITAWEKLMTFVKTPIATVILTSIVSVTSAYFAFVVNDKNANVSFEEIGATNFQKLYDLQTAQIMNLSIKVDKLTAQNETLKEEIADLKIAQYKSGQNSILFNNSIDAFPYPYWVKTRDGRMVKLNEAFEKAYLIPKGLTRMDYVDKMDAEVWTVEEATSFRRSDLRVINSKKREIFMEHAVIDGETLNILVTKFPIFLNGEVIGVAGFSLPETILSNQYIDNARKSN